MNKLLRKRDSGGVPVRPHAAWLWVPLALLVPPLLLVCGCSGCTDSSTSPGAEGPRNVETGDPWQEDLFDYAVDNLNQLEEFNTGEMVGQILIRLNRLARSSGQPPDGPRDALMETWPEPEMLRQIVNRLNQWVRLQEPPPDWKPDPLLSTLPKPLQQLPMVTDLGKLEFARYDGFALQEAVWLRDVSDWARGDELGDVDRAKRLFDWTVRNIQLEAEGDAPDSRGRADAPEWIPLMPWETLLFGRGTAMERAWVFILLCRQQRLDAVLLALGDSNDPWAVAVLSEGALYLFDPVLGLPIPAPDGVKLDAAGQLDIEPATLAQVVADEALLRQLDAGPTHPYPVKSSDLKRIVALVEASPSYLALRMKLVEARLDPQQNMVLSTAPARLAADDLKACPQVGETRLWTLPLETIQRRLQLSPQRIAQRLRAQLPFFVAHGLPQGKAEDSQSLLKEVDPFYLPLKASARKGVIEAPLHMGRMLYLKGKFADRHGAIEYFVEARQSDKQLKEEEEQRIAVYCARAREANRQQPADRRLPDGQIVRLVTQGARYETAFSLRAKQDASYWLGLIALEQANYPAAVDYFFTRTLQASRGGPWTHGARYNLARTYEVSGEHQKAIEHYLSDTTSPAYHGNLLRARWLQARQPGQGDQQPAGGEQEPTSEVPEPPVAEPQPAIAEPEPAAED